jgi:acyl-coenzyme A synthetase/AMP-(fatty) acid ligase
MVEFTDELPKTVTGKIQRFVLRRPAGMQETAQ